LIFVTVGTLFPFDRLVKTIDDLAGAGAFDEDVIVQIGDGGHRPRHVEWVESFDKAAFDRHVERSTRMVSHAGMGTIFQCLERRKPLLVVPRLRRHREHVNDHQVMTAKRFESARYVLAAYSIYDIATKLEALRHFVPADRVAEPALVANRIMQFLRSDV